MKEIQFLMFRPAAENWTPASLLLRHAKETEGVGYRYDRFGKIQLRIGGDYFEYDHFTIERRGKEDRVSLFLNPIDKPTN